MRRREERETLINEARISKSNTRVRAMIASSPFG
jgi:hypothetical protein